MIPDIFCTQYYLLMSRMESTNIISGTDFAQQKGRKLEFTCINCHFM